MNKIHKRGGGSLTEFIKPYFFSQNLKRPLFTVFCWQDPMNCASVGTKNLGNTGVWTRNTKNTIVVVKITTYAHFCCKNHKVGTFVSKITTYAFFCRENHKIRALLSRKSQHTRTLVERKKIGIHKSGTGGGVSVLWILFTKFRFFFIDGFP